MTLLSPIGYNPFNFPTFEPKVTFIDDLPVLPAPSERVKSIDEEMIELELSQLSLFQNEMKENFSRIEYIKQLKTEFSEALVKALKERSERAKQSDGWSIFLKVAATLGALLSIALGAAAIATGVAAPAGIAMIVAGGLTLAVQIASECHLWEKVASYLSAGDKKAQENIEWHLNFWASITTLVASIVSMIFGGAAALDNLLGSAGQAIQSAVTVSTGVGTLGKGIVDKYRFESEAEVKSLDARVTLSKDRLHNIMDTQTSIIERQRDWRVLDAKRLKSEMERTRAILRIIKKEGNYDKFNQ